MVRIETPFETPGRAGPPGGTPSHPPSNYDRVLHRADSTKKVSVIPARRPSLKAFPATVFTRSAKFYDEMISHLIGELKRG